MLQIGDTMPVFEAYDQEGDLISSEDFAEMKVVIYFYPKDETPGCTQEACDFRDMMDEFDTISVLVIGISPDGQESHQEFIEKHELNFELLSDPQLEVAKKFGAVQEKEGKIGIQRSTFLFDEEGILHWIEKPAKVDGHMRRVFTAAQSL